MTGARTAPGPWAGHPSTTELDVTTCHSTAEAEDLCPAWSSSHSAPKPRSDGAQAGGQGVVQGYLLLGLSSCTGAHAQHPDTEKWLLVTSTDVWVTHRWLPHCSSLCASEEALGPFAP